MHINIFFNSRKKNFKEKSICKYIHHKFGDSVFKTLFF